MQELLCANDWTQLLAKEKEQVYFQEILAFVNKERTLGKVIYPENIDVFNAFRYCPFEKLKVVILGQDPYHNMNQAHGLAFSVQQGVTPPPSLKNIYKCLSQDVCFQVPHHGELTQWAKQGVFLLNTVLTTEAHKAHSHANIGWERFTDAVIALISTHKTHVVFMLWGSHAQKKIPLIDQEKHLILTAPHPSPLSAYRGFLNCQHFSKANAYLQAQGSSEIHWQL